MGDLNLLNVFFEADNFSFKSDIKDFPFSSKETCEPEEEPAEWFTEDTLNQMLPLLDKFFTNGDENNRNFAVNEHNIHDILLQKQCLASPKMSASNEELTITEKFIDDYLPADTFLSSISEQQKENTSKCENNFSISDETFFDAIEYVREEVIEFEEICISSSPQNDMSILSNDNISNSSDMDECDYFAENKMPGRTSEKVEIIYPKHSNKCRKPMTSSPKKIRLTEKFKNENLRRKEKKCPGINSSHPRLQLTSEEIRVASKEGIELPTHYPLTKEQQRQLKRIRRKIRNKISAQHSRRRKQEYVDNLEQELKRKSEENVRLMDRIQSLENEKSTMATKIRKLQAAVARSSGQMAQPTSCLLVLIMSLALIVAPSLKNSSLINENVGEKDLSMFNEQSSSMLNSMRSSSRNLLFSQNSSENQSDAKEEFKMMTDLLKKIRFSNSNVLSEFLDLLKIKSNERDSSWKGRNYFKAGKHENFEINEDYPQTSSKTIKTSKLLQSKLIDDLKNETAEIKLQKPVTINWRNA